METEYKSICCLLLTCALYGCVFVAAITNQRPDGGKYTGTARIYPTSFVPIKTIEAIVGLSRTIDIIALLSSAWIRFQNRNSKLDARTNQQGI